MRTPDDDDSYGKGSWNRQRKDEVEYREAIGRIDLTCKKCTDVKCPTCSAKDIREDKSRGTTRIVY